jgi:hypothetical protein
MAMEVTRALLPLNVRSSRPVAISHNFMVLSILPDRAYFPSGEKATDVTLWVCPICAKISGFSAAKAEAGLMDSMKIIPKQIDKE